MRQLILDHIHEGTKPRQENRVFVKSRAGVGVRKRMSSFPPFFRGSPPSFCKFFACRCFLFHDFFKNSRLGGGNFREFSLFRVLLIFADMVWRDRPQVRYPSYFYFAGAKTPRPRLCVYSLSPGGQPFREEDMVWTAFFFRLPFFTDPDLRRPFIAPWCARRSTSTDAGKRTLPRFSSKATLTHANVFHT